ncbi:hypothetical protein SUGI_0593410 [Cryptomeria japonica]|nr:hypothetical protein SUGI_0593350 [Cryptomeria japonica]GLJ30018.1 hypothetical protein SUGI_0593410 [Cryptomeria japonica]
MQVLYNQEDFDKLQDDFTKLKIVSKKLLTKYYKVVSLLPSPYASSTSFAPLSFQPLDDGEKRVSELLEENKNVVSLLPSPYASYSATSSSLPFSSSQPLASDTSNSIQELMALRDEVASLKEELKRSEEAQKRTIDEGEKRVNHLLVEYNKVVSLSHASQFVSLISNE